MMIEADNLGVLVGYQTVRDRDGDYRRLSVYRSADGQLAARGTGGHLGGPLLPGTWWQPAHLGEVSTGESAADPTEIGWIDDGPRVRA